MRFAEKSVSYRLKKEFWIVRAIVIGIIVDVAVSCSLWGTRSVAFSGEVNRGACRLRFPSQQDSADDSGERFQNGVQSFFW